MAPTPYTPNGQLDIVLVVSGLTHRVQLPVQIEEFAGVWTCLAQKAGAANALPSAVAAQFWALAKALYTAAVAAPTWELQLRDENIFIPVDGGTTAGGAGTSGGTLALGCQTTITAKDVEQHLARLQLPESTVGFPQREGGSSAIAALQALLVDLLDHDIAAVALGDFVVTRNALVWDRILHSTTSTNRQFRRARGYV